jgi:hypothetical protein
MIKLVYKPLSVLVSVLGGLLAGAIFKRIWKLAAREDDAPRPPTPAGAGLRSCRPRRCRARSTAWSRRRSTAVPPRTRTS